MNINKRGIGLLTCGLICFGIFGVVTVVVEADTHARHKAALAAFTAAIQTGSLDTPEAFQALCGPAQVTQQHGTTTVLSYNYGDIQVSFPPKKAIELSGSQAVEVSPGTFRDAEIPLRADFIFDKLHCRGAD